MLGQGVLQLRSQPRPIDALQVFKGELYGCGLGQTRLSTKGHHTDDDKWEAAEGSGYLEIGRKHGAGNERQDHRDGKAIPPRRTKQDRKKRVFFEIEFHLSDVLAWLFVSNFREQWN